MTASIVSTERRTFRRRPSSLQTPKAESYLILIDAHRLIVAAC